MTIPDYKTKIVCTIGPASSSETVLEKLMESGMNVSRLNLAHGAIEEHAETIRRIRSTASRLERPCLIFADLPGQKIRIGQLQGGSVTLEKGNTVTLTTRNVLGTPSHIPVHFAFLPNSVVPGNIIFLNDGFVQLNVRTVSGTEVFCEVAIGGLLLSHKGVNLPGAKLAVEPVSEKDLSFVDFCLNEGIDTFGLSFIEKAEDIHKVRNFARNRDKQVHLMAKIERAEAVENIDEILDAADAVMIARGDLGVQIPIEDVPAVQKKIIQKANLAGRPVVTATQALVSMTENVRPTRAEVSDVANSILDGTDSVMLSEETAIGKYPLETVEMVSKIASSIERERKNIQTSSDLRRYFQNYLTHLTSIEDVLSYNAVEAARALRARGIITVCENGSTPLRVSRFKPDCWTVALCGSESTREFLNLSYGVLPLLTKSESDYPPERVFDLLGQSGPAGQSDVLIEIDHGKFRDSIRVLRLAQRAS